MDRMDIDRDSIVMNKAWIMQKGIQTHTVYTHTQIERYDKCTYHNLCSWQTLFCDENYDKNQILNTDTHRHIRSSCIEVYSCFWHPHASLACSVWANQEMAHCFFFSSLQHELKEEQGRNKWLKWGEKMLNVWEEERDQTTYYSDASLLTVRQTGERCHTRWTNRRQRNGATYDINAGMGWELPAWGSFPMSRHTAWAHSETATQKHNPHALQSTFGSMCTSQNIFVHSHLHYVYLQNLDAHILKNICSWWLQENISPHWQRAVYCS